MGFKKGDPKPPNSGRKPGVTNRVNRAFKEAVMNVFERGGGEEWLLKWAKRHQTAFFRIAARLIPTEVTGSLHHAVTNEDQRAIFDILGREGLEQLVRLIAERAGQSDAGAGTNGAGREEPERVH